MNDVYQRLVGILFSVWRRRWYAIGIAWIVCLLGWVYVWTIPDKFESTARIHVDTDTMLRPLMAGMAVNINLLAQVNVMQRTLLSRPNLEKIARMTDLDLTVTTDRETDILLEELASGISITSQGANLFTVGYENADPQLAQRVVQSVLTVFVESNLGASRRDLANARRFIDGQINEYERQLEEAERRQAEFRRANMGFLDGQGRYFNRLEQQQQHVADAARQLREAERIREALLGQLEEIPQYLQVTNPFGPSAGPAGPGGGPPSDLVERIQALERTLDGLLLRFTDVHPDVVAIRRTLDALQQQYRDEQQAMFNEDGELDLTATANSTVSNPVYEQLTMRVIEVETQIANFGGGLDEAKVSLLQLENLAKTIPVIEAEQANIGRDYEIIKANYEQLLKRREQARLQQDLETKTDNVQFEVYDPPTVPNIPSSPNRLQLNTLVLLLGIAAGLGGAFLLGELHTTFTTADQLAESFALPVLGTVTAVLTEIDKKKQKAERRIFVAAASALAGVYAILLVSEILLTSTFA